MNGKKQCYSLNEIRCEEAMLLYGEKQCYSLNEIRCEEAMYIAACYPDKTTSSKLAHFLWFAAALYYSLRRRHVSFLVQSYLWHKELADNQEQTTTVP